MDSTDDGFHSFAHDLSGGEENTRKSLQSRERELKAICDNLRLDISSLGKTIRQNLDESSKNLLVNVFCFNKSHKLFEKGITEVDLPHIMECQARQVLKQDNLKVLKTNLYNQNIRTASLLETTHHMNTLQKKAIKYLRNEKEKDKENLKKIPPFLPRPEDVNRLETDGRIELVRRASSAVKILTERKRAHQEPSKIPIVVGDNVLAELSDKTKELDVLNNRLAELGFE